jgi:hypothetical protein
MTMCTSREKPCFIVSEHVTLAMDKTPQAIDVKNENKTFTALLSHLGTKDRSHPHTHLQVH